MHVPNHLIINNNDVGTSNHTSINNSDLGAQNHLIVRLRIKPHIPLHYQGTLRKYDRLVPTWPHLVMPVSIRQVECCIFDGNDQQLAQPTMILFDSHHCENHHKFTITQ